MHKLAGKVVFRDRLTTKMGIIMMFYFIHNLGRWLDFNGGERINHVWTTLLFDWCESLVVYATLSEAKTQYLRQGISTLSYIDDSWVKNPMDSRKGSAQQQWVGTARALPFAVSVSFLCGYYLLSLNACWFLNKLCGTGGLSMTAVVLVSESHKINLINYKL